jgi:hypothetical protein
MERCIPIQKKTTAPAFSPRSTIEFSVLFQKHLEPTVKIQLEKIRIPYRFDLRYNKLFDAGIKAMT